LNRDRQSRAEKRINRPDALLHTLFAANYARMGEPVAAEAHVAEAFNWIRHYR
jgi:hypothetical protein